MTTRRRILAASLVLSHLSWLACEEVPEPVHDHADHEAIPATEALSGMSIFHLDSTWTDQHGRSVALREFSGRIVLLAMVYTHCEAACPRIVADIRSIRDALGSSGRLVAPVLVSIDPERDSPERLRDFGSETGLTEQGWILLRGDEDDVRELAGVFGVQYRRTSDTDFAHSNVIHVIDPDGEIVHRQSGLGVDPKAAVEVIRELLSASEGA
jgi:protein SCO1/2